MATSTSTGAFTPLPTLALEATQAPPATPAQQTGSTNSARGGYWRVALDYFLAMLGASATFSVSYQAELTTPARIFPTYYPPVQELPNLQLPAVVFKDNAGHAVLKQYLPVVVYNNRMIIDAGLQVEWAAEIPSSPRFACVALEIEPGFPVANVAVSIEPPLRLC